MSDDLRRVPAVILCNPKYEHNIGGALRACSCFGIPVLMWTGNRVEISSDSRRRIPREARMRGYQDVRWGRTSRPFDELPGDTQIVAIELLANSEPLTHFDHFSGDGRANEPGKIAYVFGPEDGSLPQVFRRHCFRFVHIPAYHCLNLAAAVNVVLADRLMKLQRAGISPILPVGEMVSEKRGYEATPVLDAMGWDGR